MADKALETAQEAVLDVCECGHRLVEHQWPGGRAGTTTVDCCKCACPQFRPVRFTVQRAKEEM